MLQLFPWFAATYFATERSAHTLPRRKCNSIGRQHKCTCEDNRVRGCGEGGTKFATVTSTNKPTFLLHFAIPFICQPRPGTPSSCRFYIVALYLRYIWASRDVGASGDKSIYLAHLLCIYKKIRIRLYEVKVQTLGLIDLPHCPISLIYLHQHFNAIKADKFHLTAKSLLFHFLYIS